MRIFYEAEQYDLGASVVALGTFDGVHAGHRALIRRAIEIAREAGLACVVCTFDRHPMEVLAPQRCPKQLMTLEEKLDALEKIGADAVFVQTFTPEAARTDARVYLENLVHALRAECVVAGFNYTFGAGGRGNAEMICGAAAELGIRAEIVDAVRDGGDVVSSTLIRRLIEAGDLARANRLKEDSRR